MLTVVMTSIPASSSSSTSCQRLALRDARDVGVRQLVDEGDLGVAGQHGVDVHLLEGRAAVGEGLARHHLEAGDLLARVRPAVVLDEADDDVGAAFGAAVALAEHGEGLADPGGGPEVDPQPTAGHGRHPR